MKKMSVYRGMMVSYFCILLPLLLIASLLCAILFSRMKQATCDMLEEQLYVVVGQIENEYKRYERNAILLSESSELMRYKMVNGSSTDISAGIDLLNSTSTYFPYVANVFTYYGTDYIYSNEGITNKKTYFVNRLYGTEESIQDGYHYLDEWKKGGLVFEQENGDFYLMYFFPTPMSDFGSSTVAYVLDDEAVLQRLDSIWAGRSYQLQISMCDDSMAEYAVEWDSGDNSEKDMWQISAEAQAIPLRLQVQFDSDAVFAEINTLSFAIYTIFFCVILILSIIVIYVSRKRYEPIREIIGKIPNEQKHYGNEYKVIEGYLLNLRKSCSDLTDVLSRKKQSNREKVASLLFFGVVDKKREMLDLLDDIEIRLEEENYFLLLVSSGDAAVSTLMKSFENDLYILDDGGQRAVVLLELPNFDENRLQREALLRSIQAEVPDVKALYSDVFTDLTKVSAVYQEMLQCSVQQELAVVCNEQEIATLLETLKSYILENQYDLVLKEYERIENEAKGKKQEEISYLYFSIVAIFTLKLTQHNNGNIREVELLKKMSYLAEQDVVDWNQLGEFVQQWVSVNNNQWDFDSILAYIQQNYTRYDLSLDEVSEVSGFSKYYLSHLFGDKLNLRYVEYVSNLRMNEAKRLLVSTDMSIQDVVEAVGYSDTSSFRRKFKKHFGVTISEMRKIGGATTEEQEDV